MQNIETSCVPGPFLLTRLLLPVLEASAPSRIINVAAHTHVFGRIHIDDLQLTKSYSSFAAYCQSKLAVIMFTRSLAEHVKGKRFKECY